jgi:hypothetical protein
MHQPAVRVRGEGGERAIVEVVEEDRLIFAAIRDRDVAAASCGRTAVRSAWLSVVAISISVADAAGVGDQDACVILADAQLACDVRLRTIVLVYAAILIPEIQTALILTDICCAGVVVVALGIAAAAIVHGAIDTAVVLTACLTARRPVGAIKDRGAAIFHDLCFAGVVDADPQSTRTAAALTVFIAAPHFGGEDAVSIRTDTDAAGIIADTLRVLFTARAGRSADALIVHALVGGARREVVAIRVGKATTGNECVLATSVRACVQGTDTGVFALFVVETAFGRGDPGLNVARVIGADVRNAGVSVVAIVVVPTARVAIGDGGFTLPIGVARVDCASVTIIAGGVVGAAFPGFIRAAFPRFAEVLSAGVAIVALLGCGAAIIDG